MEKIVVIEDCWDCPDFIDGFYKVDVNISRFGCKKMGKKCTEIGCPLPDYKMSGGSAKLNA